MRKLKGVDLFPAMRLLYSLDIKEEFSKIKSNDMTEEQAGFTLMFDIFGKAVQKNSEDKIFEFLTGPFEMTAEEIKNLDIDEICESLVFKIGINELISFFKKAALSIH